MRFLWLWMAVVSVSAAGQWTLQESHTSASLRGIHSVDGRVAWASGTGGTVLRTVDGGKNWQACAVPEGAEKLDFRGVQAFDASTAIVMSSGKGDLSRLYKTVDGCATWKLVFSNQDTDGFWDAVQAHITTQGCPIGTQKISGVLFGDPTVQSAERYDEEKTPNFFLAVFSTSLSCIEEKLVRLRPGILPQPKEGAFAASNTNLLDLRPNALWFATASDIFQYEKATAHEHQVESTCPMDENVRKLTATAGIFSMALKPGSIDYAHASTLKSGLFGGGGGCRRSTLVAVGGDYSLPDQSAKTGFYTGGGGKLLQAKTMPHGYRSAVAFDEGAKAWLAVGPNGTDVSFDDGKNWQALRPGSGEAADSDRNWNALSLPFVVGPKGRIGVLRDGALKIVK